MRSHMHYTAMHHTVPPCAYNLSISASRLAVACATCDGSGAAVRCWCTSTLRSDGAPAARVNPCSNLQATLL